MVTKYRHRRTSDPATGFPNPIEPGEIAVNTANRQIAVGDANAATIGAPLPLLGVRLFDPRARYAINDLISYQGDVLCALVGVTPGPFNAAHWKNITDDIDLSPYLPKAGGTMTGPIVLAANAAAPLQAVPLQQVQSEIAAIPPPPPPLYVSDTAPVGAPDNAMWWESDTGILYLRYNDGDSTAWVQAVALPGGDLSGLAEKSYVDAQDALKVAKTGDIMSGHLSLPTAPAAANAVRKDYVDSAIAAYAAPLDALAYSGMQINGQMDISQERGTGGTNVAGTFPCDGWLLYYGGTMLIGAVGGPLNYLSGFGGLLYQTVTTPQASLGAADHAVLLQRIEGYRTGRLAWGGPDAKPITIAFWSMHQRPGVYSGSIRNGASTRSYAFSYTQAAANVAQYNVITIPGCTDGVWDKTNIASIVLTFAIALGTSKMAPSANTWVTGDYWGTAGQVNAVAAVSDVFRITGLVVLPGLSAPTAAQSPLIMRPFDQELLTCQRYWEKGRLIIGGHTSLLVDQYLTIPFATAKRAIPTTPALTDQNVTNVSLVSTPGASTPSEMNMYLRTQVGVWFFSGNWTADARL